jgi:transcriptional regulator with XRE-family HTH domain
MTIQIDLRRLHELAADPSLSQQQIADRLGISRTLLQQYLKKGRRRIGRRSSGHAQGSSGLDAEASALAAPRDLAHELRERQPWPADMPRFEDAAVPKERCVGRISRRSPDSSGGDSSAALAAITGD